MVPLYPGLLVTTHNMLLKSTTYTRAVLRLECSLDCISGSVGHQQNIFIFSLSAFLLKLKKCNSKKCNWVSGSTSILYKLVLSPVPIVHTNFQGSVVMCLTRHYVMTDCKSSHSSGRRFPAELPSGLRHLGARNTLASGHGL